MQATGVGYKLIKKIKDDKFDEENLDQCSLFVQLGARDFQVGVAESNRLMLLEDYVFGDISSPEEQFQITKELFDSHPLLMAGFWKNVTFSVKNNKFAQVPGSLFVENSSAEYLKFNAQFSEEKDQVLFCRNKRLDAVTVYALPKLFFDWLPKVYSNTPLKFVHQSTALIEGVLDASGTRNDSPLYLYVDRFKLHIVSATEGQLAYYNQFPIKHFADYVKYIMLVLTTLGMSQDASKVILWGYIGRNSPHYHEFVKYIRNVTFGERPSHLAFGYMFDEVQEHHFFDLLSMHLLA